ncbi:MAG: sensor histidine kinase, partial [Candidatus Kapaibacterium sp.]
ARRDSVALRVVSRTAPLVKKRRTDTAMAASADPSRRTPAKRRDADDVAMMNAEKIQARSWDSVLRQMSGEFDAAFMQVEQGLEETVRAMTSHRFAFDRPSTASGPSEAPMMLPDVEVTIGYHGAGGLQASTPSPAFSVAIGNPALMNDRSRRPSRTSRTGRSTGRPNGRDAGLGTDTSARVALNAQSESGARGGEEFTRRARKKISHIQQTVRDLREFTRSLDQRVSSRMVDSVIASEFAMRNLPSTYAFGILDGRQARFIYLRNAGATDLTGSPYRTVLFPSDIVQKNHTLLVDFPTKREYLLSKNAAILSSSAVFMAIIVGSFGWTMRNLNRHKKISEMKSDFISNMTHELKTPIATIELAADALRDPDVSASSDRVRRFLGVIREENHRLRSQVERVLQAAKMERGELVLDVAPVDMHEVINEAVDAIRLQLENRGGRLSLDLHAEQSKVTGDEMHIRNVVLNLLDNAIKYSPAAPDIVVRSSSTGTSVRIDVKDAGIGISREHQKRVFERLYRVPTGNVHDVKGFGLGLSYVQSIVEAHGGNVRVESESGKGSTFTVILPAT